MSGCIRFRHSLHLSRTVRPAHSLGRNQIFLAEACRACLSQPQGWVQEAKHLGRSSFPEPCCCPTSQGSIPLSETTTNSLCWKRTQQTERGAQNAPQRSTKGWDPQLMPDAPSAYRTLNKLCITEHGTAWPITMEKKAGHRFGHRPARYR